MKQPKPTYFATPAAFRAWLEQHHQQQTELLVGFWKKDSGKPSMTWPESVDQALCFGWIDGVRRGLNADAYTIRFTPRKPSSHWSNINVKKVEALKKAGLMTKAGLDAYALRKAHKTGQASFEQKVAAVLAPAEEKQLRANAKAAAWFDAQPPGYRKTATHWVVSPKKPETRVKRLAELIACCAAGQPIPPMRWGPRSKSRAAR